MENEEQKPKEGTRAPDRHELLRRILRQLQENAKTALELLDNESGAPRLAELITTAESRLPTGGGRTLEGVFDGQRMVSDDGQTHSVPQNYASKSKLVAGDRLKLIITSSGNFIFKQIGPVERERVVGVLALDPATRQYVVSAGEKQWKVLTASVTYFHGEPGDEAVILTPKDHTAAWAAVENVVKKPVSG
jgi:hypothetical protein